MKAHYYTNIVKGGQEDEENALNNINANKL